MRDWKMRQKENAGLKNVRKVSTKSNKFDLRLLAQQKENAP